MRPKISSFRAASVYQQKFRPSRSLRSRLIQASSTRRVGGAFRSLHAIACLGKRVRLPQRCFSRLLPQSLRGRGQGFEEGAQLPGRREVPRRHPSGPPAESSPGSCGRWGHSAAPARSLRKNILKKYKLKIQIVRDKVRTRQYEISIAH